ncbi:MAG: carbohydrate ABC transporter permease [Oscillospiraceae bacterium]|nr:carbohydrate ABC transporter permease [Oscillospiraceae bacterium]
MKKRQGSILFKVLVYTVCIFLAILSLMPFVIMIINSTRSTYEIQQQAISLVPSGYFMSNLEVLLGKTFDPVKGFLNSIIISVSATACTVYFSSLTAYALVAYTWKLRDTFFTVIMCVMMIPTQVISIGFYQLMYKVGMTNNFLALILPAIAAPTTVFFMRQFMLASFPMELLDSARIDGSGEFHTFNAIALPIMKPAMATQGIFSFVASWNDLFLPSILLTDNSKYTMPIMVSLLRGDIYKTEYGAIYLGLLLTVLPILIVYFMLSKYIIAGVALGGVKG